MNNTLIKTEFSSKDLFHMIVPLTIEQLLNTSVGLLNSLMVARVNESAMSGVSLVDTVALLMVNLFTAMATGGAIIVGQYIGRQDHESVRKSCSQLILFAGEISLIVAALCYIFKGAILGGLFGDVDPLVASYANTYFSIIVASLPFFAIYCAGAALFRVIGNSSIAMWVSALMITLNVAGNAVFILGFGMDVDGVGLSTLISRIAGASIILFLMQRPNVPIRMEQFSLRHNRNIILKIMRYGIPNGLDSCMFQLGRVLLLSTIAALGTASVSANAIANTVTAFQCVPGSAIGTAMLTVVSYCSGMQDFKKARYYIKKLMKYAYISLDLVSVLILVLLPTILNTYHVSAETYDFANKLIWIHVGMGIFLWPCAFTLPNALRAAGDMRFVMLVSAGMMWLIRVALAIVLVRFFNGTVVTVWWAMIADWVARIIFYLIRVRGHKWEHT